MAIRPHDNFIDVFGLRLSAPSLSQYLAATGVRKTNTIEVIIMNQLAGISHPQRRRSICSLANKVNKPPF
jgi:hypothetical protein